METNVHEYLEQLLEKLNSIGYVKSVDIPSIDLYMDQITTFMDEQLAASKRHADDKILTKKHVLTLIFIYYFKNILSISDIQSILNPLTEKYFGNKDGFNMLDVYNEVFSLENDESQKILKDLGKKYTIANNTFENFPEEDKDFLHAFSFICMLSYDVYIKKMIIEHTIDQLTAEKNPSN